MTRETEKAFVILYSEYLRRRSFGTAKSQAVWFDEPKIYAISEFEKWNRDDISSALRELRSEGYIKRDICGSVWLQDAGISYMESKPKQYFESFTGIVTDLLSLLSGFLAI